MGHNYCRKISGHYQVKYHFFTSLISQCSTLLDATRRYSTLLDATRRYSTLLDATRRYSTLLDVYIKYTLHQVGNRK
jgi:hypothetical protein